MASINEYLILKVFDEMLKYRPALSKYIPEIDDDEEIDYRIIGDLMIKNFPLPVGVELRRLFSGSMRIPGKRRLDQFFKTIDSKKKFDIRKDIFRYTKFRNGHLMYLGTEVTEKCDLTAKDAGCWVLGAE